MAKPKKQQTRIGAGYSLAENDVTSFFSKSIRAKHEATQNVPDYKDFFPEAFSVLEPNTRYRHNWHVDYFCDLLQSEADRIARGLPKTHDYVINMMFRSLKSYIFTIIFNGWAWAKYPYLRFASASYAHDLSIEHANKTRQLIKSDWYKSHFGDVFQIDASQDSKAYFSNSMGGERKAVSVGGQFTGSGGNFLIIDDPVKPPDKNALGFKEADIITTNSWYSGTAFSRLNNPEVDIRIILMQRVHNNDLSGYVLSSDNKDKYMHICVPGKLSKDLKPEYLKKFYLPDNKTGDLLFFKERFSSDVLQVFRNELGDNYHGQVQQTPTSETGAKWKEEFFSIIDEDLMPEKKFWEAHINGWDLATTLKNEGSSSAYAKGFIYQNALYITDSDYRWLEYPELIEWIKETKGVHYIENKSSGLQAVPTLNSEGVEAISVDNKNMDKIAHTKSATHKAKRMKIFISSKIYDKLLFDRINGICEFPNSVKDDVNDAFCILIDEAYKMIGNFDDDLVQDDSFGSAVYGVHGYASETDFDSNGLENDDLWNVSI